MSSGSLLEPSKRALERQGLPDRQGSNYNAILVITIILSVSALVYVVVTLKQGEKFTKFYILGSKGKATIIPNP